MGDAKNDFFCLGSLCLMAGAAVLLTGCPNCPPYSAVVFPGAFVDRVDNPYYPLAPGTTRTYEKQTDEGLERVVVTVLREKREILGVSCTVVRDTVTIEGDVIEDTLDWFAQDIAGNVWYFGEFSSDYENGVVVSHGGSWEAGVDGAQPGIVMYAERRLGQTYYQEFYCGEAEDQATIERLNATVVVPGGAFTGCVQTRDFTRLAPGAMETKYYAPGVGFVRAVEEDGDLELVRVALR